MGNTLEKPITDKETIVGSSSCSFVDHGNNNTKNEKDVIKLHYGMSSMQGWRINMEDNHIINVYCHSRPHYNQKASSSSSSSQYQHEHEHSQSLSSSTSFPPPPKNHSLFGVFDGHGGKFASNYVSKNLHRILFQQSTFIEYLKLIGDEDDDDKQQQQQSGKKTKKKKKTKKQKKHNGVKDTKHKIMTKDMIEQCKYLLELALQKSFIDLDKEILQAMINDGIFNVIDENKKKREGRLLDEDDEDDDDDDDWEVSFDNTSDETTSADQLYKDDNNKEYTTTNENDNCEAGTTAVVVLVTPLFIVCANAGDSRAILCRRHWGHDSAKQSTISSNDISSSSNKSPDNDDREQMLVIPLSYDHKPNDIKEKQRIENAGGVVNFGRVDGELAVSRAVGDYNFKNVNLILNDDNNNSNNGDGDNDEEKKKDNNSNSDNDCCFGDNNNETTTTTNMMMQQQKQEIASAEQQKVSSVPDVIIIENYRGDTCGSDNKNTSMDQFIVIACDGIWDVLTNNECYDIIRTLIYVEGETNIGLICEEILDICLKKGSRDNMTIIIVALLPLMPNSDDIVTNDEDAATSCYCDARQNNNNNNNTMIIGGRHIGGSGGVMKRRKNRGGSY